jgi:hypothetical protein
MAWNARSMPGDGSDPGIRILMLNLQDHGGQWRPRQRVIDDAIARWSPDLVAFQDVVAGEGHDQAREILGEGWTVIRPENGRVASRPGRFPPSAFPPGCGLNGPTDQTARRPDRSWATKTMIARTSSRWMKPPPMLPISPSSHSTRRITMIVQSTVDLRFDRASSRLGGRRDAPIVAMRRCGTTPGRRRRLSGACQTVGASRGSRPATDSAPPAALPAAASAIG